MLSPTDSDIAKWRFLHEIYSHCGPRRLRRLAKCLPDTDPLKPSLSSFSAWRKQKCDSCISGAAHLPASNAAHPPRPPCQYLPGESLQVDGSGKFSQPTAKGNTAAYFITDEASRMRWSFSTKQQTSSDFLQILEQFTAQSQVRLLNLHADFEFLSQEVQDWCRTRQIKISSSAPYAHQGNGISEKTVDLCKSLARINALQAGTSLALYDDLLDCCCQQLSQTPTTASVVTVPSSPGSPPSPLSPASIWTALSPHPPPFTHPTLEHAPWGCIAWGIVGKTTHLPNTAPRSLPGVYLGHDKLSCGYRIYHADRDKIYVYGSGHIKFDPSRFPFKEQQLMGERPGTLVDTNWRQHATVHHTKVPDGDLAHFLCGKQIQVDLPRSAYPTYPHPWRALCHSVVVSKNAAQTVGVRLVFSHYLGDISTLSPHDQKIASGITPQEIFVPVSPPTSGSSLPAYWNTPLLQDKPITLRQLLKSQYPEARCMADYAYESIGLTGYYPSHSAMAPLSPDISPDTPTSPPSPRLPSTPPPSRHKHSSPPPSFSSARKQPLPGIPEESSADLTRLSPPTRKDRIVTPARVAAGSRSAKAKWTPAKPGGILPTRTKLVRQATSASTPSRSSPRRLAPTAALIIQECVPMLQPLGWEPRSVKEAQRHDSWPLWKAAIDKEFLGLEARDTWDAVSLSSVPDGVRVLPSKLVLKDKKTTGPKARLVVRGDLEFPKPPSSATYSPTPSATEVRILFALAAANGWKCHSVDISQAFVQADPLPPSAQIYVRPPPGTHYDRDTVFKLKRPLYGLSIAPRSWSNTLKEFLFSYGFTSVNCSDTFLRWTDGTNHMHLVYHVDDILFSFSSNDVASTFKSALLTRFEGTDGGLVTKYVGLDIEQDGDNIHITQEPLVRELLERFDMSHCSPVLTPMEPGTHLLNSDRPLHSDPHLRHQYQEITGTLQYLVTFSRPDLAFATSQLAKHMSNPGPVHMAAAKRVLRYLKGTAHLGLTYTRSSLPLNVLKAYADADWAACTDARRSYTGYVIMLNGAAVSWKTQQQSSVATSTAEAEFVSASKCSDDVLWLRRVLADLDVPQSGPTPLLEDNRACRLLSENPIHSRSRHIDLRVMALRERVADGVIKVFDCPTHDMVADPLTKNLSAPAFLRHRATQLGSSSPV